MLASTLDVFVRTVETTKHDEVSGSYSSAFRRDWLTSRYRQRPRTSSRGPARGFPVEVFEKVSFLKFDTTEGSNDRDAVTS